MQKRGRLTLLPGKQRATGFKRLPSSIKYKIIGEYVDVILSENHMSKSLINWAH